MSTLTQAERPSQARHAEEPTEFLRREQRIRANVLASLGLPAHLLKVAVHPLWGNKFRVNVWTGNLMAGNAIPNSYFVTADERGTILQAEPPIQKLH